MAHTTATDLVQQAQDLPNAEPATSLEALGDRLDLIDVRRREGVQAGDDVAFSNLNAMRESSQEVVMYLGAAGLNVSPLSFLLSDLISLQLGRPVSALRSWTTTGRPGPNVYDGIAKGCCVAAVDYLQGTGSTQKDASEWVARNLPRAWVRRLPHRPKTIVSWVDQVKGEGSASNADGLAACTEFRGHLDAEKPDRLGLNRMLARVANKSGALQAPRSDG